jgi:GH24 family phage-related lysozyme (muramidase)
VGMLAPPPPPPPPQPLMLLLAAAAAVTATVTAGLPPTSRCSTCRGPVHSWATLPVSFHSSHRHTGPTGAFSQLDIETIRKFPLVTIEKWQGAAAREPVRGEQLAALLSAGFNCGIFNCSCQTMADYYGKSNRTTWGCAPPPAQKWWNARKCDPKHCNTGL